MTANGLEHVFRSLITDLLRMYIRYVPMRRDGWIPRVVRPGGKISYPELDLD